MWFHEDETVNVAAERAGEEKGREEACEMILMKRLCMQWLMLIFHVHVSIMVR